MKKLILSLIFAASALATFAQSGAQQFSGVFYRVNDSTAYQTAAAAKHSLGYSDIYFNNQATTPHFDVWNGSSYDHIFNFAGGGGAALTDGNATTANGSAVDIGGTQTDDILISNSTGKVFEIDSDDGSGNIARFKVIPGGESYFTSEDAAGTSGGVYTIEGTTIINSANATNGVAELKVETSAQNRISAASSNSAGTSSSSLSITGNDGFQFVASENTGANQTSIVGKGTELEVIVNNSNGNPGDVFTSDGTNASWQPPTGGGTIDGSGTTNELSFWVDSNTLGSLTTATYPSLSELTTVKGVTSPIQTQLNTKAPLASPTFTGTVTIPNVLPVTNLTSLNGSRTFTSADDLDQTDNLNIVYGNSATPFNITVDALSTGSQVTIINKNTGTITLVVGSGVTSLVGTTVDIEEGESATVIFADPANPDVYVSAVSSGGGGSGDLTIGVSTITSGTNNNFLVNNAGLVGEVTPGTGVRTWFSTPSYTNLGSALTGTSLWPLLASGGTLTGVNTYTSNTANQQLNTGTYTTTANNQYHERTSGMYTLRATTSDEFYTGLINPTLVAGANSQKLVAYKINPTFTNGAFTGVSNVGLLLETGSAFFGTGIMNNTTKFGVRGLDDTSGTLVATFKNGTGNDLFTIYGDGAVVLRDGGILRFRGSNETISSPAAGQVTFSTSSGALTTGAYRMRWGGSSSTSGIIPTVLVESSGSVNPTSGSATFPSVQVTTPYNVTGGTANGVSFYSSPIITLLPTLTGFKHEPTNPSNITTNLAFHAVTGQTLLGGSTVTASTTLDVRGVSSGTALRIANNSNTELWDFKNDGSLEIGGSAGTSGQVPTSAGAGAAVTWTTPSSAGISRILNSSITTTGNVGTGEDVLYTYTVPAGQLTSDKDQLVATVTGRIGASGNNKTVKIKFGGEILFSTGSVADVSGSDWSADVQIYRTGAATQKAIVRWHSNNTTITQQCDFTTPSQTLSGTVAFEVTGEATATNEVVFDMGEVSYRAHE